MKLDELEKARKAQKKSNRHFYFDDSAGNIKYYGRADTHRIHRLFVLFMSNVKSLRKKATVTILLF